MSTHIFSVTRRLVPSVVTRIILRRKLRTVTVKVPLYDCIARQIFSLTHLIVTKHGKKQLIREKHRATFLLKRSLKYTREKTTTTKMFRKVLRYDLPIGLIVTSVESLFTFRKNKDSPIS